MDYCEVADHLLADAEAWPQDSRHPRWRKVRVHSAQAVTQTASEGELLPFLLDEDPASAHWRRENPRKQSSLLYL